LESLLASILRSSPFSFLGRSCGLERQCTVGRCIGVSRLTRNRLEGLRLAVFFFLSTSALSRLNRDNSILSLIYCGARHWRKPLRFFPGFLKCFKLFPRDCAGREIRLFGRGPKCIRLLVSCAGYGCPCCCVSSRSRALTVVLAFEFKKFYFYFLMVHLFD